MKKLIAIIMVLCMVLGFAGCGDSKESSGEQNADATAVEETEVKIGGPVNLFDGNIYGGMPEEDAVSYMNGLSELTYLKTTGESVIHNIYFSYGWWGFDYAHIDVTSYEGVVESVSYHFRDMNGDDVLKKAVELYGDSYEDKSDDDKALYMWYFSDGKAYLRYDKVEVAEFIEFVVGYDIQ